MKNIILVVFVIIVLIIIYRELNSDEFRVRYGMFSLGSYDPNMYSSDITRGV